MQSARAVVGLALVLAVMPCSGQARSSAEMMPGCECMNDNSKLGENCVCVCVLCVCAIRGLG